MRSALARWVRRHPFATSITSLVLLTLIVRLGWGGYLSWQLNTKLAEIRQAGHPATLSEIVIEPVADANNAWLDFNAAAAVTRSGVNSPRASILEFPNYPPYGKPWEKLAAASESAHAKAFQIARSARKKTGSQLRQDLPDVNTAMSVRYSDIRQLANTLSDGAAYAHFRGNDAEAVERLRDVLHLGRSMRRDPLLISQLVAIGVEALALDTAQQIAPTLAIASESKGRHARPEQVKALITELLDERETQKTLVRTMHTERAFIITYLTEQSKDTWAIRPLADRTKLRWLDGIAIIIEAAGQSDYPAALSFISRIDPDWQPSRWEEMFGQAKKDKIPRYSRWFEDGGPVTFGRYIEQHHRISADRRATALQLATRAFHIDHRRWPETLAELVPKYIDVLPTDPFSEGAKPLGYVVQRGTLPNGNDRPLVYFQATGKTDAIIDTEPMYGWQTARGDQRGELNRQYRDLSLWLPTTRRFDERQKELEAEAVDEHAEESDTPRDDENY